MAHKQFGPPPEEPIVDNLSVSPSWKIWFARAGKTIPTISEYNLAVAPVSVAANTTAEQTFTLSSLKTTNVVLATVKPTHQAGLSIGNVRIPADGQIAIQYINVTAGAIVPTTETYVVIVL